MTEKIFVVCEYHRGKKTFRKGSLELLGAASKLKNKALTCFDKQFEVSAIVFENEQDTDFSPLFKYGADSVTVFKCEKLRNYSQKYYAEALIKIIKERNPKIVLFSATNKGRELAPGVTSRLNTGLTADCTELDIIMHKDTLKLAATRPTYGGALMATILGKIAPECATVREGVLGFTEKNNMPKDIEYYTFEDDFFNNDGIKVTEFTAQAGADCTLSGAKVIFAGGKGLKTKENFEKLEKLCKVLNVSPAASRGAVDFGLAPQKYQVGQTGHTVAPEIYVTFGISGAIHHILGMSNSKTVVAINSDPNAPIFEHCDYKIVADANKIIDEMLKKFG